jgi:hypothetical protein
MGNSLFQKTAKSRQRPFLPIEQTLSIQALPWTPGQ